MHRININVVIVSFKYKVFILYIKGKIKVFLKFICYLFVIWIDSEKELLKFIKELNKSTEKPYSILSIPKQTRSRWRIRHLLAKPTNRMRDIKITNFDADQSIWDKIEKSSKTLQEKNSLVSVFACFFLTDFAKV